MAGRRGRKSGNPSSQLPPQASPGGIPAFRVAAGLGDPERERALLPALGEGGEFVVAERCLTGDELVTHCRVGQIDVVLAADDLHRLSPGTLSELVRTRTPLVLLASRPAEERWQSLPGIVLLLEASPSTVREALRRALRGERSRPYVQQTSAERGNTEPDPSVRPAEVALPVQPALDAGPRSAAPRTEASTARGAVVAIASGPGSPGRSTVALALATALGAVAPTILVDADLASPSLVAYLDADPTRNLYMLAHAEPKTPREWDRTLEQETQPIGPRSPKGFLLGGIPKPEMRGGVSANCLERLVGELRARYRYVLLDVGMDLLGTDGVVHRAALGLADQVLFVVAADLVGLWRAQTGLKLVQSSLGVSLDRVALVLNRHDRRCHHSRAEVEWALGVAMAAVVPNDPAGVQRAVAAQRPVVLEGQSRAGRALLDLAERLHGGEVRLPPEPGKKSRFGWLAGLRLRLNPPRLAVRPGVLRREVRGAPQRGG